MPPRTNRTFSYTVLHAQRSVSETFAREERGPNQIGTSSSVDVRHGPESVRGGWVHGQTPRPEKIVIPGNSPHVLPRRRCLQTLRSRGGATEEAMVCGAESRRPTFEAIRGFHTPTFVKTVLCPSARLRDAGRHSGMLGSPAVAMPRVYKLRHGLDHGSRSKRTVALLCRPFRPHGSVAVQKGHCADILRADLLEVHRMPVPRNEMIEAGPSPSEPMQRHETRPRGPSDAGPLW